MSPKDPFQDWLTIKQLAREFPGGPISEKTLRRWHDAGVGPPRVQCGRRILYQISQVHQHLIERTSRPPRNKATHE